MTVSTTTNKVAYIGNGVATSFAIPFSFLEPGHLKVYQLLNNIQTERTDWTVSGGNMVFATAPAENAQIVIMRKVPLTQETDYRENEILPAETLERNFDKLTMQVQQLKEQADRAVTVGMFSNTDPSVLVDDIEVLYAIRDKISTVVQNKADINTTAAHISDVNTAAANMTAIQNAPNQAASAAASAADAQVWAEGTDAQVQSLGGVHSAERWAAIVGNRSTTDLDNLTSVGEAHFVNPDVSNLSNSGKAYISGLGLPGNQAQQFTLLSSGQSYTAPSNGWFSVIAAPDANSYILLSRSDSAMRSFYLNTGAGPVSAGVFLPVLEGTSVSYTYSGTFYNGQNSILFIPAKGDV